MRGINPCYYKSKSYESLIFEIHISFCCYLFFVLLVLQNGKMPMLQSVVSCSTRLTPKWGGLQPGRIPPVNELYDPSSWHYPWASSLLFTFKTPT